MNQYRHRNGASQWAKPDSRRNARLSADPAWTLEIAAPADEPDPVEADPE